METTTDDGDEEGKETDPLLFTFGKKKEKREFVKPLISKFTATAR